MQCSLHGRLMLSVGDKEYCPACLTAKSQLAIGLIGDVAERARQFDLDRRLRAANIPSRFADATFDTFCAETPKAETTKLAFKGYAEHFEQQRHARGGFIITGAPGTGKTHLAIAVARVVIAQGAQARYASLPDLTLQVRASYRESQSRRTAADIVSELVSPDLLILDEIDLHGSSDSDYQILYEIINGRYAAGGRPVLAISNRPLADLHIDLNERLTSRISSGFPAVVFDWPSQRDQRRAKHIGVPT